MNKNDINKRLDDLDEWFEEYRKELDDWADRVDKVSAALEQLAKDVDELAKRVGVKSDENSKQG